MFCEYTEPHSSADEKFIEKCVDKDSHSSNSIPTSQSLQHIHIAECVLTSTDKDEKDHLLAEEKTETGQTEICSNDNETNINEETQNNWKANSQNLVHENIIECKNTLQISIENDKDHPEEKVEKEQIIIDEKTQNNLKGANACTCNLKKEKPKRPKEKKRAFSFLDIIICVSIIAPLTIGCWRGIWAWMDLHKKIFPDWFCFTFGAALVTIFTIFKTRFHDIYTSKWTMLNSQKRLSYRALCVLYTYIFGVACIAHWRGGWIIIDNFLFTHIWITTCLTCLLLACLAILRCIRNLIATPMLTIIDRPSYFFQFPTRYNVVS